MRRNELECSKWYLDFRIPTSAIYVKVLLTTQFGNTSSVSFFRQVQTLGVAALSLKNKLSRAQHYVTTL